MKNGNKGLTSDSRPPMFDLPPVRMSADETRAILRCTQSDKPVKLYNSTGNGLVELGIAKKVVLKIGTSQPAIDEAWEQVEKYVKIRDRHSAWRAIERLQKLSTIQKEEGYLLTDLGRQVARGVSVRIASQR